MTEDSTMKTTAPRAIVWWEIDWWVCPPPPPPVAALVVTMFEKAVNAFPNVTGEHSQAKRLNVLQHGIYILLKA